MAASYIASYIQNPYYRAFDGYYFSLPLRPRDELILNYFRATEKKSVAS